MNGMGLSGYYYFHLNQKMSVLTQKLQQASKLFQSHNFKKSLQAYQDCIDFCHKTKEDQSVIFNIMSTKATLEYILADYDKALSTLNSVLSKDSSHFLCLLRRSQVYKKKNKLKKALKDLQKIFLFCPDNLQIAAFKIEIEHLILVQGSSLDESSQSEQEIEQEEDTCLNFANLKKIDRKSSEFSASNKQRKSRVTILGDTTYEYKKEQEPTNDVNQDKENITDKIARTRMEIEQDSVKEDSEASSLNIRVSAPKAAKRSILKNKGTSIFIETEDQEQKKQKYLGRESNLIHLLKSIDGRLIHSGELEHEANKEVIFRKSVSQIVPLEQVFEPSASMMSHKSEMSESRQRKSCLKRPSFEATDLKKPRRSKFEEIDANKIDGKIIIHKPKLRNSMQDRPQEEENASNSDNDSSSHNIFGSRGVVMTPDIKQKLGLNEHDDEQSNSMMSKSLNLSKKMSILKKNSSIIVASKKMSVKETKQEKELPLDSGQKSLRSKKSVMFNCTL